MRETNRSNNDHEKAELFSVLLLRLLGPKDWGWRDYHQAGVRREDKARGAIIPQSKPGVQNAVNLDLTVLRERERESVYVCVCVCVCVCMTERVNTVFLTAFLQQGWEFQPPDVDKLEDEVIR